MFEQWSKLPIEIQLKILRNVLVADEPLHGNHQEVKDFGSLLRTYNRHLTTLAQDVHYQNNAFLLQHTPWYTYGPRRTSAAPISYPCPSGTDINVAMLQPSPKRAHLIRNLHIEIAEFELPKDHEDFWTTRGQIWQYVLKPRSTTMQQVVKNLKARGKLDMRKEGTRWQKNYDNLRRIAIIIKTDVEFYGPGRNCSPLNVFLKILDEVEMVLKADYVSVSLEECASGDASSIQEDENKIMRMIRRGKQVYLTGWTSARYDICKGYYYVKV